MSFSVQIGLLLALATAFASIVGFLYKHRGAVESPAVDWRRPVWSSLVLFRSRWYTLGIVIAMGSWGLHVGGARARADLARAVGDRGRPRPAHRRRRPALRALGDAPRVDRRRAGGRRARVPRRDSRRRRRRARTPTTRPRVLAAYVAACDAVGIAVAVAADRAAHHGGRPLRRLRRPALGARPTSRSRR